MAGMLLAIAPGAEVALVAATAKSVIKVIAAANLGLELVEWGVSFDGVSVTGEPVLVELLGMSTAGAGTSGGTITTTYDATTGQVKVLNGAAWTPQLVATYGYTAEPTAVNAQYDVQEVHPQAGYRYIFPLKQETIIPAAGIVVIRCKAAAAVNCRPFIKVWE